MTWNCNRATKLSPLWDYFRELSPDIAVLQEVSSIPQSFEREYDVRLHCEATKEGGEGRTHSVLLVRGIISKEIRLRGSHDWITRELGRFGGNLPAYETKLLSGEHLNVVNVVGVYSPYWHFAHLGGTDISPVKLKQNAKIWLANLLQNALRQEALGEQAWIVAGDFNMSETFDYWTGRPRGNRKYLDNMLALGLTECLREASGKLTPTFKNTSGGKITAQIDHLWVSKPLASTLVSCVTGDVERVFGAKPKSLSDHLPILCDADPRSKSRGRVAGTGPRVRSRAAVRSAG